MVFALLLVVAATAKHHVVPVTERCGGYAFCASASQQTSHDGWGWIPTSRVSCIVRGSSAMMQKCPPSEPTEAPSSDLAASAAVSACDASVPSTLSCGGYPSCNCASSQTDPAGWGWERQASCIVRGSSAEADKCSGSPVEGGATTDTSSCASLPCPQGITCGCYLISGLGERKQQVFKAGGVNFLASSMMETNNLLASDYPLCDGKFGLACNAGIAKQNFGNSRPCSRFASLDSFMSTLNSNLSADAQTYNACFAHYGTHNFMAGHRNGATGLMNLDTPDINAFIAGFQWKVANLQAGDNMSNDVRFWVQIQAI